jgi:peptide/nickel transport system substrate-binding protein
MDYQVITPTEFPSALREFEIIQQGFSQIGVRVTPQPLDPAAHFEAVAGSNNTYPHFDFHMWQWGMEPDPYHNLQILTKAQWGGLNDTGYDNPVFDKLYQQQEATLDRVARRAMIFKAQRIIYHDKPYIPLTYLYAITAHTRQWTGFQQTPSGPWSPVSNQSGLLVRKS